MNIKVYKCSDEELKNGIRDLASRALEFMFKKRKKLLKNIHVSIKLDSEITTKENAYGLCMWTDHIYRPKKFSIVISDKLNKKMFKKTLLHELVHVKQYIMSELKDCYSGQIKWKRKIYEDTEDFVQYINTPWEKQAYSTSERLYKKLCIPQHK